MIRKLRNFPHYSRGLLHYRALQAIYSGGNFYTLCDRCY